MNKFYQAFSFQFFVLFLILVVPVVSAQIEVTRTDDPTPDGCNSGTDCSLREAIIAANNDNSENHTIQLTGGLTYTLSISGDVYSGPVIIEGENIGLEEFSTNDEEGALKILNADRTIRIESTGGGMAEIDADGTGPVFMILDETVAELDGLKITGGDTSSGGGLIVAYNESLTITNSLITGNTALSAAGMDVYGGTVVIEDSEISQNESDSDGVPLAGAMSLSRAPAYQGITTLAELEDIEWTASNVTIQNSTISNNTAEVGGAFDVAYECTLNLIESTVSGNRAYARGGAFNVNRATVNIDRSTISGNIARNEEGFSGRGGGFFIGGIQDSDEAAEILIINSTISGNETGNGVNSGTAGGIYVDNFGAKNVDIINSTITNNTGWSVGGILAFGGTINVANSIIANQAAGDDCQISDQGEEPLVYTSLGYNLESETSCGFTETGDLQNLEPFLGPLQDNGGPVFTHALSADPLSPAINNGSNTLYTNAGGNLGSDSDANGNDRVYDFGSGGIIDIGAFELQQEGTVVGCPVTHEDNILFVKNGETGTGANWSNALGELRDALALFEDGTCTTDDVEEIWVTAGTYLPTDDSGDREATFLMPGVDIYGGFEGDETNENQRDLESNISILSGEINDDGNLSGNSYHVVTSMDESSGVLFDFTITGGNANGSDPHDKGGGLYASNGGISMGNVLFEDNYAETAGGGAYVIETVERIGAQHPSFFRSTFRNNEAGGDDADGGGLALDNAESRITSVLFENNSAGRYGGGLFNDGSDAVLKNVIVKGNSAGSEGGGILNNFSSPELFNVLITGNDAYSNGGGMVNGSVSNPVLTNVTISGNQASGHSGSDGGGMYNRNGSDPTLLNSIVWGNTAVGAGNEIWNSTNSTIELDYSLFSDGADDVVDGEGFTALNSWTTNPQFENAGGGDFTLKGFSPAINTGDPDTEMSDFKLFGPDEIDLAENPRVYNGDVDIIDIGAYEFQGEPVAPSSCPATDGILFVKKGESGTGASWDNALGELRDVYALFDSEDCTTGDVDEIWVAAGTYLPTDNSSDRTASFSIINNVNLFGGFEGVNSETSLEDRDWETYVTILSGDIDDVGGINGNSYHVVTAIGNASETILDGFTITGGNANSIDEVSTSTGGGLYVDNGTITIRNSVFNNNFAEISGGGVFIKDSGDQPIFTNVEFSNNSSNLGGGLASENSSPRISESSFSVNFAEWGGGARLLGGSPLIDQTVFTGNTGNTSGGGLSLKAGTVAKSVPTANAEPENQVIVTNSEFRANNVTDENGGGGGIQIEESNVIFRNILVSGNSSDGDGGGILFADAPLSLIINSTITGNRTQKFGGGIQIIEESSPTIQNSIVWNNDSIDEDYERADNFSIGTGTPVISYSMIEGCKPGGTWDEFCGTDGGNNFADTDPLFDTGITPGDSPTTDGDFTLTSASPVINIGDNTLYNDSGGDINNDLDLAEEPRLFDGNTDLIDLGAYEFQGEPDGEEPEFAPFITTWEVEAGDLQITIPTAAAATYNYDVDWGDGDSNTGQTGDASHTYDSADTYTVKITGIFPQIEFFEVDDKDKILSVEQWGDIEWASMRKAFQGTTNLVINATDTPDLSNVTSMLEMFSGATSVNGGLENWNVSTINSMFGVFDGATSFNGDISGWTVSAATDMIRMFAGATAFDRDIGSWTVDNVNTMESMFDGATSFDQDLSGWNTGDVGGMSWMFHDASSFNQDLGDWDISNVSSMTEMLDGSGLSQENYDNTLIGWESQAVMDDVPLGAAGLEYCDAAEERDALIDDHNWNITGDALAGGCDSVEGEDQLILAGNHQDYIFSGNDFGVSNENFSIIIETLPDEGALEYDGGSISAGSKISVADINDDLLTWNSPSDEYGYNFTSFEFTIADESDVESEESYTMTIDLGTTTVELSGSEGWRFMSNPSDGDSYFDLFSEITVDLDFPNRQTLYELDQPNYAWDPVGSTGNEPGTGIPFIVYVPEDDLPVTVQSGASWNPLDGSHSYSGLDYDGDGSSANPGNFYLLGNPHPITLDFCEFTGSDMATSAYFWDPEAGGGNGDYLSLNCAAPEDVLIAPFQAFWVRTTDTNPMLNIPMTAYLEGTTDGYFKEKSEQEEQVLISLNVTGEDGLFTNRAQVLFTENATEGLDRFDAPKLSAEGLASQWLSFHSMDENGRTYAFQSLPASQLRNDKVRIPLDIQTTEAGRFALDWALPESHVFSGSYYLRDNETGDVIELREGGSYSFEIESDQVAKLTTHPMSELAGTDLTALDTHRMNSEASPRFELLIAASGVDGLTELGAVPEEFTLSQNYPNPFNPTTVISYQLPVNSEVRLEVYDMLGRNVATLVNEQVSAGRHKVNFDASNLSSGIYLYRLAAGSTIMTKKLTVIK